MNATWTFGLALIVGVAFVSGYVVRALVDRLRLDVSRTEQAQTSLTLRDATQSAEPDEMTVPQGPAVPAADPSRDSPVVTVVPPALPEAQWTRHPFFRNTDRKLAYEPLDPQWAARMESRIYAQINASDFRVVGLDVLCRSTLCRVQMTHAQPVGGTEEEGLQLNRDLGKVIERVVQESIPEMDIGGASTTGTVDASGRVESSIIYFYKPESAPAIPISGGTGVEAEEFRARVRSGGAMER
jgi:hypothetical protein